jgi:hypothetical protein
MTPNLWIVLDTFAGSAAGAAAIVFIDWLIKKHQATVKNFHTAISIQIALNQTLSLLLQFYKDYEECKNNFLNFYNLKLTTTNPTELWGKFRHIDLRRFNQTYTFIELNWDFSQFLSKKVNGRRKLLEFLITARAAYQHINNVLKIRNALCDRLYQCLSLNKEIEKNETYLYRNNHAHQIIGDELFIELQSATNEYLKSLPDSIKSTYNAFNEMSKYIDTAFCSYAPLELSISNELKNILQKIQNNSDSDAL